MNHVLRKQNKFLMYTPEIDVQNVRRTFTKQYGEELIRFEA